MLRTAAASTQSAPTPGNYYLALGDSLAAGVGADGVPADPGCISNRAPGYVCLMTRFLRQLNPNLRLDNLGISGADSCVLVNGSGAASTCADPMVHRGEKSQLQQALALIKAHPGQVNPISLDIGGDNLVELLPEAEHNLPAAAQQIPGLLTAYRSDLDATLSQLHAADPNAEILVAGQYNPLSGIPSMLLPKGLGSLAQNAIDALNGIMKQEAPKYGAAYVDVDAAFRRHPGGAFELTYLLQSNITSPNIHPTAAGYRVYAGALAAASGYRPALRLTVNAARRLPERSHASVHGHANVDSAVAITLKLPGKSHSRQLRTAAGPNGYAKKFWTGKHLGKGWLRVCETGLAGHTRCGGKHHFKVSGGP